VLYRPFDRRWIYYTPGLTSRPAWDVMQHMQGDNFCLLVSKQQTKTGFHHIFCSSGLTDHSVLSLESREITSIFPTFLRNDSDELMDDTPRHTTTGRKSNVSRLAVERFAATLGVPPTGKGEKTEELLSTESLTAYIYAVLHSPAYRKRYGEELKLDFPRIPLTRSGALFTALRRFGYRLLSVHLQTPESRSLLRRSLKRYKVNSRSALAVDPGFPQYRQGRIYFNASAHFESVSEEVWNFWIGGFQVCHKWLKDRRGRDLSEEDIVEYEYVIAAIKETIEIMSHIDKTIDAHGGWPLG
jgi:predicted helicase